MSSHLSRFIDKSIALPIGISHAVLVLADSHKSTLRVLQPLLENGGYTVLATDSGTQAVQMVLEHHPHLVILGDPLRDASGAMICRQIKSDETLGYLPIILLAECKPDLLWEIEEPDFGPDAVLCQPVELAALQDSLWSLLRIKRQFDQQFQKLAAEMRKIEMLKTDIIANVSHELGTPLLQVKSAVSLLAEGISESNDHEQHLLANMATQAVARLESIVNNIRQLARTRDIQLGPVVLHEAADLAIRFLERSWTSRGAQERIVKDIPADLPLIVGDKRALGHLLQLLLDNALKFSPPEAPVYILASALNRDQVWVGVQDVGIGIAPEQHARIFEAFYQVNGGANRPYGGTGTGLTLAMLLAKGMNTTIDLKSVPGTGSTFSFVLPVIDLNLH